MIRRKPVSIWLWTGVVMVFIQITLGGITRLTGSGLSITRWEIVTGTLPPLNAQEWDTEFSLYKQTPQYQKINEGMTVDQFKFIYFWEYIHRLWARLIGLVFLIPFFIFAFLKWLDRELYINLGISVCLGALVASIGWIMVQSGLVDRPWVNAYKLTIHLNLALILYSWLVWIAIKVPRNICASRRVKSILRVLTTLIILQLIVGGLMSGMKACLYYPTWPDMHGEFIPKTLIDNELWTIENIQNYEQGLMPGIVQFVHRLIAYLIFCFSVLLFWKTMRDTAMVSCRRPVNVFLLLVISQICLGILTLIHCGGSIPMLYGVLHQMNAILLLTSMIYLHHKIHK